MKRSVTINAFASTAAEFLFVLLPLIVIALVLAFKGEHLGEIMASPEWSFGSAILGGQTLVRLVSGLTKARRPSWQRVSFAVAALFVLTVVPALIVLAMIIISGASAPRWLILAQSIGFLVCATVFFAFGTLGHAWLDDEAATESERAG